MSSDENRADQSVLPSKRTAEDRAYLSPVRSKMARLSPVTHGSSSFTPEEDQESMLLDSGIVFEMHAAQDVSDGAFLPIGRPIALTAGGDASPVLHASTEAPADTFDAEAPADIVEAEASASMEILKPRRIGKTEAENALLSFLQDHVTANRPNFVSMDGGKWLIPDRDRKDFWRLYLAVAQQTGLPRWFCFSQTSTTGSHFKLVFDIDGDAEQLDPRWRRQEQLYAQTLALTIHASMCSFVDTYSHLLEGYEYTNDVLTDLHLTLGEQLMAANKSQPFKTHVIYPRVAVSARAARAIAECVNQHLEKTFGGVMKCDLGIYSAAGDKGDIGTVHLRPLGCGKMVGRTFQPDAVYLELDEAEADDCGGTKAEPWSVDLLMDWDLDADRTSVQNALRIDQALEKMNGRPVQYRVVRSTGTKSNLDKSDEEKVIASLDSSEALMAILGNTPCVRSISGEKDKQGRWAVLFVNISNRWCPFMKTRHKHNHLFLRISAHGCALHCRNDVCSGKRWPADKPIPLDIPDFFSEAMGRPLTAEETEVLAPKATAFVQGLVETDGPVTFGCGRFRPESVKEDGTVIPAHFLMPIDSTVPGHANARVSVTSKWFRFKSDRITDNDASFSKLAGDVFPGIGVQLFTELLPQPRPSQLQPSTADHDADDTEHAQLEDRPHSIRVSLSSRLQNDELACIKMLKAQERDVQKRYGEVARVNAEEFEVDDMAIVRAPILGLNSIEHEGSSLQGPFQLSVDMVQRLSFINQAGHAGTLVDLMLTAGAQKVADAVWKRMKDAEKDQYRSIDASLYARRDEYIPTDDEPFSGKIIRELVDVIDMTRVPRGLQDYINKYIFVSRMPQHTKSRGVFVFYRKRINAPLVLYDLDNLLSSELVNKYVWSSKWPEGSRPKSPLAFLMQVLDESIQIAGEDFAVTDKPGGIIMVDESNAYVNLFKGFAAKILPRSEFDYDKVRLYLDHARHVLCRAAKYDPKTGLPEYDDQGHIVPDSERDDFFHSLISAMACVVRGIKVKFEINISGPKGVGKTNWFAPIVNAIGDDYAWIFDDAKKHFSGNFDANAATRLLAVCDEGGIAPDSDHRPSMRAKITNNKAPNNPKGVDQKMKRNPQTFVVIAEDTSTMDLADRRAFYMETLDLLRPFPHLSEKHAKNKKQKEYHDKWQASVDEPHFLDHLLTYLYLIHDIGDFVPHSAPKLTPEHSKLRGTARPAVNRWAYDFLHGDADDQFWTSFTGGQAADAEKRRFMSAVGRIDLHAKEVSRHFVVWDHIDKGGAADQVPDTKRYRGHRSLEAALKVEMQASPWFSECYSGPGKRMEYVSSAHSSEHGKSGAWYRFDVTKATKHISLTEDMCVDDS
jgi:hypothetical protein